MADPLVKTCPKCEVTKIETQFLVRRTAPTGKVYRRSECADCFHKLQVAYREKRRANAGRSFTLRLVDTAPEGMRTCRRCRKILPDNLEFFSSRDGINPRSYCRSCAKAFIKEFLYRAKLKVLTHYSNGIPKCACPKCGETNLGFLTIDHVNSDGAAHRRQIGRLGNQMYTWLENHDWPGDGQNGKPLLYRVLCFNCNMGRQFRGGPNHICPHEQETELSVVESEELVKSSGGDACFGEIKWHT